MNSFNFIGGAYTFSHTNSHNGLTLRFCSAEILPTLSVAIQAAEGLSKRVCQVNLFSRETVSVHSLGFFFVVGFSSGLWLFGNANGCLLSCPYNICLRFCCLISWSFGICDLTKQIKGFQWADCMNAFIPIASAHIFPVSSLTSGLSVFQQWNKHLNKMHQTPVVSSGSLLAYDNLFATGLEQELTWSSFQRFLFILFQMSVGYNSSVFQGEGEEWFRGFFIYSAFRDYKFLSSSQRN